MSPPPLAVVQMYRWGGPSSLLAHLGAFKEAGTMQMERTSSVRPQTADKSSAHFSYCAAQG